jgi:hypothetical protein
MNKYNIMNKKDKINLEEAYINILFKEENSESETTENLESDSETDSSSETQSDEVSNEAEENSGSEEPASDISESKKYKSKKDCNCGKQCCNKKKDLDKLKEAYETVQENWLKKFGAAAALTAATAAGAHAHPGMTNDDYADKAAIEYAQSPTMPTAEEAFKTAIEKIHKNEIVSEPMLKIIATDSELAKRCAHLYFMKGLKIPPTLKKVIGNYEEELKSYTKGPLE